MWQLVYFAKMRHNIAMHYIRFFLVFSCMIASAESVAQQSLHEKFFSDLDGNKDGKIFKPELPQNLKRNFDRIDVDNNGYISIIEHVAFFSENKDGHKKLTKDWSGFKVIRDISYVGDGHDRQSLDLALPSAPSGCCERS